MSNSPAMLRLHLKPNREASLRRFHPWVFSGAIARIEGTINDGDVVEILDHKGNFLALGHYHEGTIAARIFSFNKVEPDTTYWQHRLEQAIAYRRVLGLPSGNTNCFRLVHAEGDGLPGLVIDMYNGTAVLQCHSIGMHRQRSELAEALLSAYEGDIVAVYDKSKETLPDHYAATVENSFLYGNKPTGVVLENGHQFHVDWQAGQKTGFFLDQRANRELLKRYVQGCSVLNTFSYSGGFSIYALRAGARLVHSVDASQKAIEWCQQNVNLNKIPDGRHEAFHSDVNSFLKNSEEYDVVIVDPPAFAKSLAKRHNAVQGYRRLNAAALRKVSPGGVLFTFSCSQAVDRELFHNTIVSAALDSGRKARVMHHLSQSPDHPVSLYHPEGAYLKGIVLYVE